MPSIAPIVAETVRDPEWLPHRYDPQQDAIHFVHAPRSTRNSIAFLTDEYLKPGHAPRILSRRDALECAPPVAPVHFILHSAFCCSTLLARAFDMPGTAFSVREPQILNDLVGWRHRGGRPESIGEVVDASLKLLARPFEYGETCVIKPSNVLGGLSEATLAIRPQARCILLYAPIRVFLASIARKGMDGRLWVRELLSKQLIEGLVNLGFEPRDYLRHTDLQAAAVGWLAQHQLFAHLARRWPDRMRTLNSEVLVARPVESLQASAALFGLSLDRDRIVGIVDNVFSRDAKTESLFAPGQREAERLAGEALHADEINKVAIWAEAVARAAGVELIPPAPLLTD